MQKQIERSEVESNDATTPDIEPVSTALDSPRTKLVYLYLATVGAGNVEEVREDLGIQLISLYPVLETLTAKGLVEREGSRYVCKNT